MIKITRQYFPGYTSGILTATGGVDLFDVKLYTIELPWLNNVRRLSCIPSGLYEVVPHVSPRFGQTLFFTNVPGRSEILFHAGNSVDDLQGCIAPGVSRTSSALGPDSYVQNSQRAMALLISTFHAQPSPFVMIE